MVMLQPVQSWYMAVNTGEVAVNEVRPRVEQQTLTDDVDCIVLGHVIMSSLVRSLLTSSKLS